MSMHSRGSVGIDTIGRGCSTARDDMIPVIVIVRFFFMVVRSRVIVIVQPARDTLIVMFSVLPCSDVF